MGFDAVRWLWRYFLLGAVIVIPIWLIARLIKAPTEDQLTYPSAALLTRIPRLHWLSRARAARRSATDDRPSFRAFV